VLNDYENNKAHDHRLFAKPTDNAEIKKAIRHAQQA